MAGSATPVEAFEEWSLKPRLLISLYVFGALLIFSNIVVCFDINFPEGSNIKFLSLALWPPFTIAFTGALWVFLATSSNGRRVWWPISLIGLAGAAVLLTIFGAVPYTGDIYWGAFLVPSVTLLSIAGISLSWRALDSFKTRHFGKLLSLVIVCVLLLLSLIFSSAAIYYLFEFVPMTMASAIIWGWVFDPARSKRDSRGRQVGLRIAIFFVTFFFIPLLVLLVPFLFFWAYFT